MKLRNNKLKELMATYANNNYNEFARQLKVDPSHLHKFMTKGSRGGLKLIQAVINLCKEKGIDPEEVIYIEPVTNVLKSPEVQNWNDLFNMVRNSLCLILEENTITEDLIIKATYDILKNAGYHYRLKEIKNKYIG